MRTLSALLLMILFPIFLKAQNQNSDKTYILKTNLLLIPSVQQWTLYLDNLVKNKNQSNTFGISYDYISDNNDLRKSLSISYRRFFYSKPIFEKVNLFIAPYSKMKFRKVYQEGSGTFSLIPISERDFTSTSLVLGAETGFQVDISKRLIISTNIGLGGGYVLFFEAKQYKEPANFHLDAQFLVQFGYRF